MIEQNAFLEFEVFIDCPHCGKRIDLTEGDDGTLVGYIFTDKWEKLNGERVYCECGEVFKINELIY